MGLVRSIGAVLAVTAMSHMASAAEQDSWLGFYRLSTAAHPDTNRSIPVASGVCLTAILQAQTRYNIPDNILLAIGIQEAGRQIDGKLTVWPWTANAKGKGVFFNSKDKLEAWVQETQASVTQSVDVGCMQVNQKWHARAFASLEEAIDPATNVDYAARFLLRLYGETFDWWEAAGRYHSSTESYKRIYLNKLVQNQKLANAHMSAFVSQASETEMELMQAAAPWYDPSINWTSDMTGANSGDKRDVMSIYSSSPLQVLLPDYAEGG